MPSSGIHSPAHRRQPRAVGLSQAALALGAGFLVALALPPWGWWPLAFVGIALFEIALGATPRPRWRFALGSAFGFGWLAMGIGWMWQLTAPGYVAASLLFAVAHGLAELAAPPGRWRVIGRPAAHTLIEAVRFSFPAGGVPLASLGISQAASPVGQIARVGGAIMVTWVVFQVGFALGALVEKRTDRIALGGIAAAVAMLLVAFVAPTGRGTGRFLDVAAVQGGGEQGTSALEVASALVTARHLEATRTIEADGELDLVLWPENVIDIDDGTFTDSEQLTLVAAEAARLGVPVAVGVTEDAVGRPGRIFNAQVIVTPDGAVVDRYDKVRRVPFGEYVPMRGLLEALGAPIDQVPSDAIAGTGPAVLELPDGTRLAVAISWEIFFGGRVREGVKAGGEVIINPTNGASYTGTILQTQQVASSRLRAIETGRWVVQASPTGFSEFVTPDGDVLQRTRVSEQAVIRQTVELRTGRTWYVSLGDRPWIAALVLVLAAAWLLTERDRRPSRRGHLGAERLTAASGRPG